MARRFASACSAMAPLPISMLSVSSSRRREGSMRQLCKSFASWSGKSGCRSWRPERLTESWMASGSAESARQAWSSTQRPSGTTMPVSSASGMNSDGGTRPRSRCSQRDQRLDAQGAAGGEVDDGLVMHAQLAALERTAQLVF